jgi:tetratricopeptide (TPR) repeat protein
LQGRGTAYDDNSDYMGKEDMLPPGKADASPDAGASSQALRAGPRRSRPKRMLVPLLLILNTAAVVFAVGLFLAALPKQEKAEARGMIPTLPGGEPASRPSTASASEPAELGSVSWSRAQQAFAAKDYARAVALYLRLAPPSAVAGDDDPLRDLVVIRQAQCFKRLGNAKDCATLLAQVARSRLPLARALANQMLAVADIEESRWSAARVKAYAAMGSAGAFAELDTDCDFVAAYARTREVLALCNADIQLVPPRGLIASDPLAGLGEQDLQKLSADGPAGDAVTTRLAPVKRPGDAAGLLAFRATCRQAPLEDLLAKLSSETGREIRWDGVTQAARQRAVTMAMDEVSEQRLAEIACGMCGLQARFTGEEIVVRDPETLATVAAKRELLVPEAMAAWRRLFLRWPADSRLPEGQFALAAVYEAAGDVSDALSQYRQTAERYFSAEAAPLGLLQSARLRMKIRDYGGAYADLLALLDGHPDHPASQEAYLYLGESAFLSDQVPEAIRSFRKLYFQNPSAALRSQACLGLGKCFHRQGDFKEAARWLWEYIDHSGGAAGEALWQGALLAAKCEESQGDLPRALKAVRIALAADAAKAHEVETTLELSGVLQKSHDFVGALGSLQRLESTKLSEGQAVQMLLLRAGTFRAIGLGESAISLLRGRLPYSGDPNLGALLTTEIGRCHAAEGDYAAARTAFTDAVSKAKSGPAAWDATCELAQTCLACGDPDQAAVLAGGLVHSTCPPEVRHRGCEILAGAYIALRDYSSAACVYEMMKPPAAEATTAPNAQTRAP